MSISWGRSRRIWMVKENEKETVNIFTLEDRLEGRKRLVLAQMQLY